MPQIWSEQVLPRLVDVVLADALVGSWRRDTVAPITGDVLEVGFGSGRNLPHYPPSVTTVHAVEPSEVAWQRAQPRIARFARPVQRIGLDGAQIALPDASVDAVVSTWTLCTIPNLGAALAEMRRVLRPGGVLRFVEHSLAPDDRVARAQHLLSPAWQRVAGGCHLDRDIPALVDGAGFSVATTRARYLSRVAPSKPLGWMIVGQATVQ